MISLVMPPKSQIPLIAKMLGDEYGTASNIKSRVNRLSVLSAITSTQQRLKLYNRCPENGLVIYCGEIMMDDGKTKKVSIDFEPFRPINTSLYMCDNKFHTQALTELLADDQRFGFIVMDGNGSLYGTVCGNTREVLYKFSVDLPKKHGRGGQSSVRFARLRVEKRHNYVRKVAEHAVQHFIQDDKPTIAGLVLAGSAEFKQQLTTSELLDPRLVNIIIKYVDVAYGGENGFNQAIELAAESLANVKLVKEKKLITRYFEEIAQDTGRYCFGVKDTMTALELSSVETLIVWEELDAQRYELRNNQGKVTVLHLTPEDEKKRANFVDADTGLDLEIIDKQPLVEWFANNYKSFGAVLEFVTNKSQEGSQFAKGFGGIGAVLRWKVDFISIGDAMGAFAFGVPCELAASPRPFTSQEAHSPRTHTHPSPRSRRPGGSGSHQGRKGTGTTGSVRHPWRRTRGRRRARRGRGGGGGGGGE
jgi:peptide chain release factor subunit 1